MLTVVHHRITDPAVAFARGEALMRNEGAPRGARVLQFLPSRDSSAATCLWESESVAAIQEYVDAVLGDASENRCYEVDADHAFAEAPSGVAAAPAIRAE
jgi:hypothetical protein